MTAPAPEPPSQEPATSALPRGVIVLLGTAGLFVSIFGIRELSGLIGPIFLALMLVVAVQPVQTWLERHRVPRAIASIGLLLVVYGIVLGLAAVLAVSVARLATLLPEYSDDAQDLINSLDQKLQSYGVGHDQLSSITSQINLSKVLDFVGSIVGALADAFGNLALILVLIFFMGLEAASYPLRLSLVAKSRGDIGYAMSSFARGVRRYLVVSTIFGLIVAVFDTVLLYALDVPLPVLWGLLAFITNYIPNIGFVVGLIPPALLALLDGGVSEMIWVIVLYSVINFVIQTIIQPRFVGDSVGLSTTVTFIALVFWAWALGPLGALLAVPLTLLAKALLVDIDPATRWLNHLLGVNPKQVEEPPDDEAEAEVAGGGGGPEPAGSPA